MGIQKDMLGINMEIRKEIGDTIARIRKKKGLTQARLAEKSGVSLRAVVAIENGKFSAGIDLLYKIATALDSKVCIIENSPMILE